LPGLAVPTGSAGLTGTGTQAGVGVGVGGAGVVGVGVGVCTGGEPEQIAMLISETGTVTGEVPPPPPPQLNDIAAAKKISTGAKMILLRPQRIEH
jgi:hypothetical protein